MDQEYEHPQVFIMPESLGGTQEEDQERILGAVRRRYPDAHVTPEFVATKVQELDINQVRAQIGQATDVYRKSRIAQARSRVVINTDEPVTAVFQGDVHYGHVATDHDQFHAQVDTITGTRGLYAIWMSNMIDNAIPAQFPNNMLENVITPDKQVTVMRKVAEGMNAEGKLLATITSPCHEGWAFKHAGQDVNVLIYGFPTRKFPVLENGGQLDVQVGQENYRFALYHQGGPFNSNFNKTHVGKQLNRLQEQMKPDVVANAHNHVAAVEKTFEGKGDERRPVCYIRTGTMKGIGDVPDNFIVGRRGASGEPTGQSVTLFPNEHIVEPHLTFEEGVRSHEAHRTLHIVKKWDIKKE